MNDDDRDTLDFRRAFQKGQRQAEGHANVTGILTIVAGVTAILLPIVWYWKILAFLGILWVIAMARGIGRGLMQIVKERTNSK